MSRIGKLPVSIPEKTEVAINGSYVSVKGPKGQLEYTFTDKVEIKKVDSSVVVTPVNESIESRSLWGTKKAS